MKLEEFFKKIQSQYNYCLDFNAFSNALAMYPAILVSLADDEFSTLERGNIISAIKESADNDIVAFETYRMLNNLLVIDEKEKSLLLQIIKETISDNPDLKAIILELMISAADAEDGISTQEATLIEKLKSTLAI